MCVYLGMNVCKYIHVHVRMGAHMCYLIYTCVQRSIFQKGVGEYLGGFPLILAEFLHVHVCYAFLCFYTRNRLKITRLGPIKIDPDFWNQLI